MNEMYFFILGVDFYGVGGFVEGVEVIFEYCVGLFIFFGYY